MPTGTSPYQDEAERLSIEAAIAFAAEMRRLALTAPAGQVLPLCEGEAIGSGLVEGTLEQRVNVRVKRGSARWLPQHVGPFVELMAMADTVEWGEFWAIMAL